jgi:hypothetical protein
VKKGWKIVFIVGLSFLLLVLLSIGLTQTKIFRDWLRGRILAAVHERTNGTLVLGEFSGSLFTGLRIEGVSYTLHDEQLFSAKHLELRYNPLALFQKHIALGHLVISQPHINLKRTTEGAWNFDGLWKERTGEAKASSYFPWVVELRSLEVMDGEFTLVDSTESLEPRHLISQSRVAEGPYERVALKEINAKIAAAFSSQKIQISVDRLKFASPSFATRLDSLSLGLEYTPRKLALKNLTVHTTGSSLSARAEVESLKIDDLVQSRAFQNHHAQIEVNAPEISLSELQRIIPAFPIVNGRAAVSFRASGTLGQIDLDELLLKVGSSEARITGRMQNLFDPKDRSLDIAVMMASANLGEIRDLLPSLGLPDMSHLGSADVAGSFKGSFEKFDAKLTADVKEVGQINASALIDLRGEIPEYQGWVSLRDFNPGAFLGNEDLEGSLNARTEITGKGSKLDDLEVVSTLAIDSSEIANIDLQKSAGTISVQKKVVKGDVGISLDGSSLNIEGAIDLRDRSTSLYDLHGRFLSLDLSKILLDENKKSNLNGSFVLQGAGLDLDEASGALNLTFEESEFHGRNFHGLGLKLSMDQRRHDLKSLQLESPFVQVKVEGDFHWKPFLALVDFQVRNVLRSLRERLPFVDTTSAALMQKKYSVPVKPHTAPAGLEKEYLDFTYEVNVMNLTPLAVYLGGADFNAKGVLKGFVTGDSEDLLLGATASVENFIYREPQTKLLLSNATINLEADHLVQKNVLDAMENKANVTASMFVLNGLRLTDLRASVGYRQGKGSFDVAGTIDSVLTVETHGIVEVSQGGYVWEFNALTLDYRGYVWLNNAPFVVTMDTAGVTLKDFEMAHKGERLQVRGGIRQNRELALVFDLRDVQLSNLWHFFPYGAERNISGLLSAAGSLGGQREAPVIAIRANSKEITYATTLFGGFDADFTYSNKRAEVKLEFNSSQQEKGETVKLPNLLITGSFPIDLGFVKVEDRLPDGPLDLRLQATAFRLGLLDPFIPEFEEIQGRLTSDVHFGGQMKNPESSGSMKIEDGQFVFKPNGIRYFFSGEFEPRKDRILISRLQINTEPKSEEAARLSIDGQLTLRGLAIESFDLNARGELLVLRETARKSSTTPFGNVLIGIGGNGLRYYGTVERSWLTGSILVRTMAVTFPPVALLATGGPRSAFLYTVLDDTTKPDTARGTQVNLTDEFLTPSENGEAQVPASRHSAGFLGRLLAGIRADVSIETQGPTQLRMIFTYSTGEELFSEVRGKLFLTKDEFGTRFTGDVEVAPRSYYYFYKRFDATGKLKFSGPLDNPELEITATYEGYRSRPSSDTLAVLASDRGKAQHVVVTLKITGSRISPKLSIEMTVDGVDWPGDVQSDAISFIVSGKFRDDLTSTERNQLATSLGASVTSTVITGVTSSLFSGIFTDFLRREFGGFIRQAELSYSGGSVSETADLRLTGEIGKTVIRVGGRVFNDIGNANVSVQMPVGKIVGAPALEDLIIELERKVEGSNYATDEKKLTNGARIYYRIAF